jgi:very-short-patch-repair endonuclease
MECFECFTSIDEQVWDYSMEKFGVPLCRECQVKLEKALSKATDEAKRLYFELKRKRVPAELEKWDGSKHIDIAVTKSRLNIEVDGSHHNTSSRQALSDLKRTYYSFKRGYFTLRIPNALLHDKSFFEEVVNLICEITEISAQRNRYRPKRQFSKDQSSQNQSYENWSLRKILRWGGILVLLLCLFRCAVIPCGLLEMQSIVSVKEIGVV